MLAFLRSLAEMRLIQTAPTAVPRTGMAATITQ
jgi:hypothetical protein